MWYDMFWGKIPVDLSKVSSKRLARWQNQQEYMNNFQQAFTTAMNVFKWTNLPDTCDERMIERALLLTGRVLFAEVDGAILSLAGGGSSSLNIYGYPTKAWGWGFNGFNREFMLHLPGDDSKPITDAMGPAPRSMPWAVLGYDNCNAYPYVNFIITACERLTQLMRSMDVTVQNLKQPVIITCEESLVNTVRETLNNRDNNVTAIISTGSLPIDGFKVWKTEANPDMLGALREQYEWVYNTLKTIMGLNSNEQIDKRERLLVDEVNANNEVKLDNVEKRLVYRQRLCEQVNSRFGTNITVELRNKEVEDDVDGRNDDRIEDPDGAEG